MPHFRTFAEALRVHRKAAGLTQVELAVLAETSRGEVTSLESGKIKAPHPVTAEALASALDLDGPEREHFLALARGRESTVPQPSQPAQLPLVGRRTELALLDALLDGHGPPALFVAGEPGIGKTRFLAESARLAQARGWQVVTGGCTRQSGQEPYAPWPSALGRHLAATAVAAQRQRLQGCAWLVRLLPELAEGRWVPTPSWTLPPAQERRLVVQAVGRYLANCAGPSGTLLVLDDLQWAGDDAIALLANLVPGEDGTRGPLVRLLGAYRSTEVRPAQPLGIFLADLAKDAQVTKRALPLLTDEEAGQLLEEAVREHDFDGESSDQDITAVREQLVRRAHGLPFALISSVRALKSGVPLAQLNTKDALSDGIRARVAALADLAQRLLGIAAVIGRVSPVRLLLTLIRAGAQAGDGEADRRLGNRP
ncbi:MAG TPA: AAA family ATPase [Ktedonobacterales bacterium]